jgi:hypothetical protein
MKNTVITIIIEAIIIIAIILLGGFIYNTLAASAMMPTSTMHINDILVFFAGIAIVGLASLAVVCSDLNYID